MNRRLFILAATTTALSAVAGAAAAQDAPPTAAPTPIVDDDYVLGPGDKVRLGVFGEPSLSGEFVVSTSGAVSLPLVGEVRAASLPLGQFRDSVRQALMNGYLRDPRVSVEILSYRPFYILGEVARPGEYPYTSGLNAMNAIATAGGFTYRAQTKYAFIRGAKDAKEQKVELTPELKIRPGDTVRVAERFF